MRYTPALAALVSGARRGLGSLGPGSLSFNSKRPGGARAPGPGSHLPWASPGAPVSLALLPLPSRTPRPAACLHTSCMRTRRSRTSSSATLPHPLAASSPSSAPSGQSAARSLTRRRFPPETLRQATRETISEILERPNPARRNRSCPRAVKKAQSRYKRKTGPASTRHTGPPLLVTRAPKPYIPGISDTLTSANIK